MVGNGWQWLAMQNSHAALPGQAPSLGLEKRLQWLLPHKDNDPDMRSVCDGRSAVKMREVPTAAAEKALSWFRVKCKRVTLTGHSSWTPPPMPDIAETKMQDNTLSIWEIGEICRACTSKRHSSAVLLIMSDRQAVVSGESTVYHPGWRHLASVSFRKAFLNFGKIFFVNMSYLWLLFQ